MARIDPRGPANADPKVGPLGFRYPEEQPDSRPVLRWSQFWTDESERLAYEDAVHTNPRRPGEAGDAYVRRISELVTGAYRKAGLSMPRRMSQKEWQRRQNELKAQAWREMGAF